MSTQQENDMNSRLEGIEGKRVKKPTKCNTQNDLITVSLQVKGKCNTGGWPTEISTSKTGSGF